MLTGLIRVEGGQAALPFVRLFYGSPSEYLWEDDAGTVHRIPLEAAQRQLRDGERLLALLDDIFLATPPARVGPAYTIVQQEWWLHAGR